MIDPHIFARPTSYTHQLGTWAILAACGIYLAIIFGCIYYATRGIVVWP